MHGESAARLAREMATSQRQDSLAEQMRDLHRLASAIGCFDAADWLWKHGPLGLEQQGEGRAA